MWLFVPIVAHATANVPIRITRTTTAATVTLRRREAPSGAVLSGSAFPS
jgi:hypothetical protein